MKKPARNYIPKRVRNNCIFCGRSPTNREHIYSRSIHRFITKSQKKWKKYVSVGHLDRTDVVEVKVAGDPHDLQVKCVCEQHCNNGWMRETEDEAKPILTPLLKGEEARLSQADQTIIARWMAIKVTVLEFDAGHTLISTARQRHRLMERKTPPQGTWRIWLGRYKGIAFRSAASSYAMSIKKVPADPVTTYNSQIFTFVVGELLIHLVRLPDRPSLKAIHFRPELEGKLRQIWPTSEFSIRWPPRLLTDAEAHVVEGWLHNHYTKATRRRLAKAAAARPD